MKCGLNSEPIRGARTIGVAACLLVAAASCSDDEAHELHDAQSGDAAQSSAADSGASAPQDELKTIFAAALDAYDRQVESDCPCFVEQGGYETVEACLDWQKSADHWVSCGTEAFRPYDSPELRANLRCVKERADRNTACSASIECSSPDRTTCSESLLLCFAEMSDLVLVLDDKCPDFSLLPRQAPDGSRQ